MYRWAHYGRLWGQLLYIAPVPAQPTILLAGSSKRHYEHRRSRRASDFVDCDQSDCTDFCVRYDLVQSPHVYTALIQVIPGTLVTLMPLAFKALL